MPGLRCPRGRRAAPSEAAAFYRGAGPLSEPLLPRQAGFSPGKLHFKHLRLHLTSSTGRHGRLPAATGALSGNLRTRSGLAAAVETPRRRSRPRPARPEGSRAGSTAPPDPSCCRGRCALTRQRRGSSAGRVAQL